MKKSVLVLLAAIMLLAFVPVGAGHPDADSNNLGRIRELEARVQALENKLQGYETLKNEVANLESFVNFILSDAYVDMVCQYCNQ